MTLLTLELLGDSTSIAETTHTLDFPLSFKTAKLRAVDIHAPGSQLTKTWLKSATGDADGGSCNKQWPPCSVYVARHSLPHATLSQRGVHLRICCCF